MDDHVVKRMSFGRSLQLDATGSSPY
jgi:hypothetical protein